jgi:glucose/arabinose dehydrogenase
VDYPPNFDLKPFAQNLNCPTSICFDPDGTLFIVEGGIDKQPLHIFGRRADGSTIEIYPQGTRVPFISKPFRIYGPVGGIAASGGKLFVAHRDINDMGVITAFGYDGTHSTVVSEFPSQGEYGITDIAVHPGDGRLYFGVGPATNSGLVGIDDWEIGWLKKHPNVCDISPVDLKLYGLKFVSHNPFAGFFGGATTAVTGPFQPFDTNEKTRIPKALNGRANSCVYSISPSGGDLTLVASGIRLPRGLGFAEGGAGPYATNDGMEMRGTRPIKDDPDAFVKVQDGAYFGFPDFTSIMIPVTDERYQPSPAIMSKTGYPDVNPLVDRDASNLPQKLLAPSAYDLLKGSFLPMSGAAKFDFIPDSSTIAPYRKFRGHAIVALSGDRAPFATSGQSLPNGPVGYKIVCVNPENKKVSDFIYNVRGLPASKMGHGLVALERPCDVKLAPDGSLYILDMGAFSDTDGKLHVAPHTGRIFKLVPIIETERPKP